LGVPPHGQGLDGRDTRDSLYSHPSHGSLDMRFVFGSGASTLLLPSVR